MRECGVPISVEEARRMGIRVPMAYGRAFLPCPNPCVEDSDRCAEHAAVHNTFDGRASETS